jgi:hypothetical protein
MEKQLSLAMLKKERKKERKRKEEGEDAILSYCFIYIKWL